MWFIFRITSMQCIILIGLDFPETKLILRMIVRTKCFPGSKHIRDSTPYNKIVEDKTELCSTWYNNPWLVANL